MANRKVQIDILADAKNFQKGTAAASQSASTLEKALGKLGPVGNVVQSVMDKIGLSSVASAAGVAGGLLATVGLVEKSISMYTELADKVRNYSSVTGQSAEDSSRQIEAFQRLGVAEDVAATGMFRLAREAATAPDKLKALGVEVAVNNDGTTDLNRTLLNVIDAYQRTGDAAERDRIVFAAFGKGGAALIPILETNREELKKLEEQAGRVYTQQDLDNARRYQIQQDQVGQTLHDVWLSVAQAVVPTLADVFEKTNANVYAEKRLTEAVQAGKVSWDDYANAGMGANNAADQYLAKMREEYTAGVNAKTAIDGLTQAQKAQAQAALDAAKAEQAAIDADEKLVGSQISLERATLHIRDAQQRAKDAQEALTQAQKDYGTQSKEAYNAATASAQAQLDLKQAYLDAAKAAKDKYVAEEEANSGTRDATAETKVEIDQLQKMANSLAPGSPLRQFLQGYINQLKNDLPRDITTNVHFRGIGTHAGGNIAQFAEGGTVPGPVGAPQLAVVHGGEEVIPAGGGRRGGETHIHLHIGTLIGADGPGMDRLAQEILRRARYAPGT